MSASFIAKGLWLSQIQFFSDVVRLINCYIIIIIIMAPKMPKIDILSAQKRAKIVTTRRFHASKYILNDFAMLRELTVLPQTLYLHLGGRFAAGMGGAKRAAEEREERGRGKGWPQVVGLDPPLASYRLVNHQILLQCLQTTFGIDDNVH